MAEPFEYVLYAGRRGIALSAAVLAAILIGNTGSLIEFYKYGRGSYSKIVDQVTLGDDSSYVTSHDLRTGMVVDYFTDRLDRQATLVPVDKMCSAPPAWLILERATNEHQQIVQPAPDCTLTFERTDTATAWDLAGTGWTLYRRHN